MEKRVLTRVWRKIPAATAGLIVLHTTAATAWAQKPVKPPEESATLQWVIALGVMVVVGIAAFLNPKRSHRA